MRILRAVSQRGYSVATAGWFTVLRPNTWFAASRMRKNSPSYVGGMPLMESGTNAVGQTAQWQPMERSEEERNKLQLMSAVIGAVGITSAMLWWIMHP